jgi:glutathione S-transferase
MSEYQLYCFAQSGNAYRAALMLNLVGAEWKPIFVDYFGKKVHLSPEYRSQINEMGEIPVLVDSKRKLSQSGVILTYLAEKFGKFLPQGDDERLECLRWIIFDNQKVNGYLGPFRAMKNYIPNADPGAMAFLKGRFTNTLGIVNKRLEARKFLVGERPTIADVSLAGYLFYPADEFGFDIGADYPAIGNWRDRIRALPGWAHPYELMPGHPLPAK